MLTKIELIAIVQNNTKTYTLYFFQRANKIVLPIILPTRDAQSILLANSSAGTKVQAIPATHDTLKRTLLGLRAGLASITIYRHDQGVFYSYLNISENGNYLEINAALADSLILAFRFNSPIFIKKDLLIEQGVKVSAQLLKEALEQPYMAS